MQLILLLWIRIFNRKKNTKKGHLNFKLLRHYTVVIHLGDRYVVKHIISHTRCIILIVIINTAETLKYTATTIGCKSPGGLGNILDVYKDVRNNWRPPIYVQIGRPDNNIFVHFTTDARSRLNDRANNYVLEKPTYSLFYLFNHF